MAGQHHRTIHPIILSGGAGKRLWPLSTIDMPKQFHALCSDHPLIIETALRVQGAGFADPIVICNESHRFHVASAFQDYGIKLGDIILEPCPRNTAAAIATAVHAITSKDPDGIVLVLPCDHYIGGDDMPFMASIQQLVRKYDGRRIVTFGISPSRPETGYGYICRGAMLADGLYAMDRFVEKPTIETAQSYMDQAVYYWNSGIYMGTVEALRDAFLSHSPALWAQTRAAFDAAQRDLDFLRLDQDLFAACDDISFDCAIMEKLPSGQAALYPLMIGWNDLGSWSALWDVSKKDAQGNAIIGDVVSQNNTNCYIRNSNDRSLAVIGLEDIVVVSSQNAVAVAHKDDVQSIRAVYDVMSENDCPSIHSAIKHQPWGYSKTIQSSSIFAAKEIVIRPATQTAMQIHAKRSEHWVVLEGTATFVIDGRDIVLKAGQSCHAMPGTPHALKNMTDKDVRIFEVQSGVIDDRDTVRLMKDSVAETLNVSDQKIKRMRHKG